MKKLNPKVLKITQAGILIAIMLIMDITKIGYLKFGLIEITIMMIPVVIGAIMCGPAIGGLLGGIFGLTSLMQCFGQSAFGTFLMGINPLLTVIVCLLPRILVGVFSGLIFKAIYKIDKTKIVSFAVATLSGALLNTLMFMGCLILFFWNNDAFITQMKSWSLPVDNLGFIVVPGISNILEYTPTFLKLHMSF